MGQSAQGLQISAVVFYNGPRVLPGELSRDPLHFLYVLFQLISLSSLLSHLISTFYSSK